MWTAFDKRGGDGSLVDECNYEKNFCGVALCGEWALCVQVSRPGSLRSPRIPMGCSAAPLLGTESHLLKGEVSQGTRLGCLCVPFPSLHLLTMRYALAAAQL